MESGAARVYWVEAGGAKAVTSLMLLHRDATTANVANFILYYICVVCELLYCDNQKRQACDSVASKMMTMFLTTTAQNVL